MRNFSISILGSLTAAAMGSVLLLGCGNPGGAEQSLTMAGEEREVQGTVTETTLTACAPEAGKPGTCEGTMVVQPQSAGTAESVAVQVTRDIALNKDGQAVFLPQLKGTQAVVKYRSTREGPNLATSVNATS